VVAQARPFFNLKNSISPKRDSVAQARVRAAYMFWRFRTEGSLEIWGEERVRAAKLLLGASQILFLLLLLSS